MSRPCRYDRYTVVAAQLEGTGEFTVDVCEDQARYVAHLQRSGGGVTVSVDVDVCLSHDMVLSTAPGWKTSIMFRQPLTT